MKLSSRQIALMSMLIALNVVLGGIVQLIKMPVFLDAIGTILGVVILGLVPGIVIGVLSFVVMAVLVSPVYIWFIGTQAVIALIVYLTAKHIAAFRSWRRAVCLGLMLGLAAGIVSAPVIVMVFGGVSGSGRDLITAGLLATGSQIGKAVFLSGAASEPVDKTLQVLAAFFVLQSLPKRLLLQFKNPLLERNSLV